MERLEFDLLFRWFVGLSIDDAVWDHSTFSKNRDRLLAGDVAARFLSAVMAQPRVVIEGWRRHYNAVRPHSSLGYRPPAPEAVVPSARPPAQPRPAPAGALTMETRPPMN